MSDSEKLLENSPSGIRSFRIGIVAHDGEYFDVSDNVTELSLFESIYRPYIHGHIAIIDNSMMLSDFPFVGQERAIVQWRRDDRLLSRVFYITKIQNAARQSDGVGVYEMSLNSVVQTRNAINLFSQSYRGRSDEIIEQIFIDHLGASPVRMNDLQGKTSHNVVFPFMKPLQAVDMIQKNVLADDDTPMFVYDTFYTNEIRLDSFGRMYDRDTITTIESKKPTNTDSEGQASRTTLDDREMIYDESIDRAYDTYENLSKGAFSSNVTLTDSSIRQYEVADFKYKQHAPSLARDWISPSYEVQGESPNDILSTKNIHLHRNSLAFNEDFPNLNTIEDLDRSILNSYVRRHATTVVKVHMDSIAYTLKTDQPFTVGQTVDYKLLKYMPKLSQSDDSDDVFNSGKYVVSAIRHFIKNYEYTMSIELIRDGVGEKSKWSRT